MEHEDMRLISAYKFCECAELNNHAKRHLPPTTVIQDSYNGKIITVLKQCSRHVTHDFKKGVVPERR